MKNEGNNKNIRISSIEGVIIAIVLGAVTVTAVPRFSEASDEEKFSDLACGLQQVRAHLDLYRLQHEGRLPPADSFRMFRAAMLTAAGQYQPYIRKIPANPFNSLNTIRFDGGPAGAGKAGWRLDTKTGIFQADNDSMCAAL